MALRRLRKCAAITVVKVLPSLGGNRAGARMYALGTPASEPVTLLEALGSEEAVVATLISEFDATEMAA